MRAILLVAHGSRREASNQEVRAVAERLAALGAGRFQAVEAGFLEIAQPSIPDGLRRLIAAGADEVLVVPHFLSAGRHVAEDIPAEVEVVRAEHPAIPIRISPYLGAHPALAGLLLELATSA